MNLTGGEYRHFKIGELSVGKMLFVAILCKKYSIGNFGLLASVFHQGLSQSLDPSLFDVEDRDNDG